MYFHPTPRRMRPVRATSEQNDSLPYYVVGHGMVRHSRRADHGRALQPAVAVPLPRIVRPENPEQASEKDEPLSPFIVRHRMVTSCGDWLRESAESTCSRPTPMCHSIDPPRRLRRGPSAAGRIVGHRIGTPYRGLTVVVRLAQFWVLASKLWSDPASSAPSKHRTVTSFRMDRLPDGSSRASKIRAGKSTRAAGRAVDGDRWNRPGPPGAAFLLRPPGGGGQDK